MHAFTFSLLASLVATVAAQTVLTGQYTCVTAGDYNLCQNLWGEDDGTGSQNTTYVSSSGDTVSWSTTYTWADNENDVKSYANVESNVAKGELLSAITSAPTAWSWTYDNPSSGLRADVSYDIWFGTTADGAPASTDSSYEIMIWLSGEGGIQPVGSQITTGTSIAGYTWDLWYGPNETWEVYSFVSSTGNINDFDVDLNEFFVWLEENEGISSSLYLQAIESGTEPFTGSATLVINSYSVSVST